MAKKRYKPEDVVGLLRQVEVSHSQGMTMADSFRQFGFSEVTHLSGIKSKSTSATSYAIP